jgi:hypothetical protein
MLNVPVLSGVNSIVLLAVVNVFLTLNALITIDLEHPGILFISATNLTPFPFVNVEGDIIYCPFEALSLTICTSPVSDREFCPAELVTSLTPVVAVDCEKTKKPPAMTNITITTK